MTERLHTEWFSSQGNQDVEPLPPYTPSKSLSLISGGHQFPPQVLRMTGESRSPKFTIISSISTETLFEIDTDSTLVYHETTVRSARNDFSPFYIKRKCEGDRWTYTAEIRADRKSKATKAVEIVTDSQTLSGKSRRSTKTKFVFRNAAIDELDALYLLAPHQRSDNAEEFIVLHRDEKIGTIKNIGTQRSPEYELNVLVPGVDPLLFVVLALVLDDRTMTSRRRLKRSLGSGWTGVGKGPGAGLAGAYAIASF